MKQSDISLLMKGMAPVIAKLIGEAVTPFADRITELEQRIADMPTPRDGQNGRDGKDGAAGIDGKDGQDGVGLAGAVQSKDGHLVMTLTSGATVDIGRVAGQDGKDGEKGVDGKDGRDGVDGIGFDDLDLVETEEGVSLRAVRGEVVKEWPLPVVFYRGIFNADTSYRKGNSVTWGGSLWIAEKNAPEGKPDMSESGWRLAVKKGQNGKDLTK